MFPNARKKSMVDGTGHFHAVRFYYDSDGLCQIIADFIAEGLNSGQPAVIVATLHHTTRIEALLSARGFDVAGLKRSGDLFVKDAAATLDSLMVDDLPSSVRFQRTVGPAIVTAAGETNRVVRVYGEMVDILWKRGATGAAAHLEALWNSLANTHAFVLLCAYALEGFTQSAHISQICSQHTHVVTASGEVALVR